MDWLIFALLGTIFFSAAGVLDKLLLSSYANDSKAYIVCQVLAQQLFTVPVIMIIGVNFVYPESIFALVFGCLQVLPAIFFMRALQVEEASKVTALEYVYPIFVFIGSAFLLGEMLDPKQCAGGLLLLVGTLIISYKKSDSNSSRGPMGLMSLSPAIKPFLSYWILTALYYLSLKYLLISIDEWHLYTWSSIGSLVAVVPLLSIPSTRREVFGFFAGGNYAIGGLISEETFQFMGLMSSIFAYSLGSVSLVSSVGALQPILTVILIIALGIITPKLAEEMEERTDRRALIQKSLSFMIVLLGIYFVS